MIRSSKHSIANANFGKKDAVKRLLIAGRIALQEFVDYLWENPIYYGDNLILDIKNNKLNSVRFIDYNLIKSKTNLSARVLSSIATQACGIVSGAIKRKSKYLFVFNKLQEEGKLKEAERIKQKIENMKISKPIIGPKIRLEFSSKCVDFEFDKNSFDCFIRLKSLGEINHIKIPVNLTKTDHKWNKGKLLGSILLGEGAIDFRYENPLPELKSEGKIVGADTGVKSVITLSDGQSPELRNIHGYCFQDILSIMSRKKRGSKAFKQSQEHRTNFINWSINQLNLAEIRQINLEHIDNLFYKKNFSSAMKRFTNREIEQKLIRFLEENGVRLILKNATYKSQRCNNCGMVCQSNRNGKIYTCKNCGIVEDADLNAALNNEIDLPEIPFWLISSKINRKSGFLWKPDGLFSMDGQELNESLIAKHKTNNI